jgi:hypothetical protein
MASSVAELKRAGTAARAPAEDDAPGRPAGSRTRAVLLLLLACGVVLRVLQYAVNRSLWLDEGLLVSNILPRTWAGLLEPLHRGQTAPLGFMAVEKALAGVLGPSELVLRLVPLLAGVAALLLFPRVARRYVSRGAVPLAVGLVALAPFLIYYSSEVKQYSLDALCTVVVLGFAARLARDPHHRRTAVMFGVFGVVAVWFSQPVVFMLGGTGLVLGVRALRRGDRRALAPLAACAAAWLASFAGSYPVSRNQVADPEYMKAFWESGFLPLLPGTLHEWTWLPRMLGRLFREPMGVMGEPSSAAVEYLNVAGAVAGGLAFAAGCVWAWRRRRFRALLLLAPLGLALCASAARVYPLGALQLSTGRVLVYLVPVLALVMAQGAVAIRRALPGRAGTAAFAAVVAVMFLPSVSYATLAVPQVRSEVKPLLRYVNEQRRPGDVMYVYYNGQAVFEYYAPRYGWNRSNTVAGACARFNPELYVDDLAQLAGRERVWVLMVSGSPLPFAHERRLLREDQVILGILNMMGTSRERQRAVGAELHLYDLTASKGGVEPFQMKLPPLRREPQDDCRGSWEWRNQLQ